MLKLALVLVHNKGSVGNFAQIEATKLLGAKITDTNTRYDDQGKPIGTFDTYHYQLKGLPLEHEVRFYQVIPFGVAEPANFHSLDSHNVIYRKGDEDKTGDHPRFFNWGLKRGTDYGADVVMYLQDVSQLDLQQLTSQLLQLADKTNSIEFVGGENKLITLKSLQENGQFDETKTLSQAVADYNLALDKALSHG